MTAQIIDMNRTAADILRDAKALIDTKGWTQGTLARDAAGKDVDEDNPQAVCFCGVGAVYAASATSPHPARRYARNTLDRAVSDYIGFPQFNDTPGRTKEEVLAAFDKAIAFAEAAKPHPLLSGRIPQHPSVEMGG